MECSNCEVLRKDFICSSCLAREVRDHRYVLAQISAERDSLVLKAEASLPLLDAARERRAHVASLITELDSIQTHTRALRTENENTRERIIALRSSIQTRRQTLEDAYRITTVPTPPRTPTPTPPGGPPRQEQFSPSRKSQLDHMQDLIDECLKAHYALQDALAHARQGLVHELVDVFAIVEVGGRPAAGVRSATRGEWAIGSLVLPVPGDMRRYPPTHVNAALTFTIHFLGLLTFYLGIRLPFRISWSGGKLGIGIPEIYAAKGTDSGGWARWTIRNPLHLPLSTSTSDSPPPLSPSSPPSSPRSSSNVSGAPSSPYPTALSSRRDSITSSTYLGSPFSQTNKPASFATAFAMLLYSVAYLGHTQGADLPLSAVAAGEILRNLWTICCSAELGRSSHDTHPPLPPPTPPSFALDFRQLLQATAVDPSSPAPKVRRRIKGGIQQNHDQEEDDGWEVVDEA